MEINLIFGKDIEQKLRKVLDKSFTKYCEDISQRMYWCYEDVIDMFYADYSPKYYKRTYSLYQGATNSPFNKRRFKKRIFVRNDTNNELNCDITMEITAQAIKGEPYHVGKNGLKTGGATGTRGKIWVFERAFEGFIHGFTPWENKTGWLIGKPKDTDGKHLNRWGNRSGWIQKKTVPHVGQYENTLRDPSYRFVEAETTYYEEIRTSIKSSKLNNKLSKSITDLKNNYVLKGIGFDKIVANQMKKYF